MVHHCMSLKEKHSQHYHFANDRTFQSMIWLIESPTVCSNLSLLPSQDTHVCQLKHRLGEFPPEHVGPADVICCNTACEVSESELLIQLKNRLFLEDPFIERRVELERCIGRWRHDYYGVGTEIERDTVVGSWTFLPQDTKELRVNIRVGLTETYEVVEPVHKETTVAKSHCMCP